MYSFFFFFERKTCITGNKFVLPTVTKSVPIVELVDTNKLECYYKKKCLNVRTYLSTYYYHRPSKYVASKSRVITYEICAKPKFKMCKI